MTAKNQEPSDDAWGERVSAYLDGELSRAERDEVERLVAVDPAAASLLGELRAVRSACAAEAARPVAWRDDLARRVLADAERRSHDGHDRAMVAPRRADERALEPEGDFGLPFGRSPRSWTWAGVAVAAAVLIGFYGRPEAPTQRAPVAATTRFAPPMTQVVQQMRQAMPQLQVVTVQTTPEGKARLERLLAERFRVDGMPDELVAAQRAGLPVERASSAKGSPANENQMFFVSADSPQVSGLVDELEKEEGIFRVEADRPRDTAPTHAPPQVVAAPPALRGQGFAIRITLRSAPSIGAPGVATTAPVAVPGRVPVLLVIEAQP